jgi:hypothetical protein
MTSQLKIMMTYSNSTNLMPNQIMRGVPALADMSGSARTLMAVYLVTDQLVQNSLGWGWFCAMLIVQLSVATERNRVAIGALSILCALLLGGLKVL